MIRTIISILLFTICSHSLFGQAYRDRMRTAIDMGSHSNAFVYADTRHSGSYTNDYACPECEYPPISPANDIFYKLTLIRSMYVDFNLDIGSLHGVHLHILNSSGKEIKHYCDQYSSFWLNAGVYYFVIEPSSEHYSGAPGNGVITTRVECYDRIEGEDFSRPLNIGTFDSDFSVGAGVKYFSDYMMNYREDPFLWDEYHDMVHEFTITQSMGVTLDNYGSYYDSYGENEYHSALMSSQTDTINPVFSKRLSDGSLKKQYDLVPGRYFIYSWGKTSRLPDSLAVNLNGKLPCQGSDFKYPIDIDIHSEGFFYYENTFDTSTLLGSKQPEKNGNEVYYRITLAVPMELSINNCGSEVRDTYLKVYSSDMKLLYANDYTSGRGACEIPEQAFIQIPVLMPGSYYIVADGEVNGNINLLMDGSSLGVIGDLQKTAINVGTYNGGFVFTDTRNTSSGYTNQFNGKPTNDVFYKLTLHQAVEHLKIDHQSSILPDTYLSLLNAEGTVLYSSNNASGKARLNLKNLTVGTYYIVSEGIGGNGTISTHVEARGANGYISTTKGQPHVISFTPTVASSNIESLGADSLRQEIQYYDHFGNPDVKVQHGFSPLGDDIFILQEYDGLNRETNQWLPVTKGNTSGAYVLPGVLRETAKTFFLYGEDSNPYSRNVYDGSPLNEVVEQYGPGSAWHSSSHSVKTERMTNLSIEDAGTDVALLPFVAHIYRAADASIANVGAFPTASLNVLKITDEDNNISYEFKDKSERTILVRQMNGSEMCDTYTVYDDYGNIRFVLPPLAADNLYTASSWSEDNETLKKYAYIYQYDRYNRCIYKKLPGSEPVYTVYDAADRAVFTQDGNLREKGEWTFHITDAFNRIALTGICKNELSYSNNPLGNNVVNAVWTSTNNAFKGYHIEGVSLNNSVVFSANFYDTYDFLGKNGILNDATTNYTETAEYGKRYSGGCKGQQTGAWTAYFGDQLEGGTYSVMYYDDRYRVIQQKGTNALNGVEEVYMTYNFEGGLVKEKRIRTIPGKDAIIETRQNTYDLANRLLKTSYQLNDNAPIALVDNVYDEIGRLKMEKRNGDPQLTTDYVYNLRSWLKNINSPLFSQTLNYQETVAGNIPCFNGNVSSMSWGARQLGASNEMTNKGYRFTYDGLSRLQNAIYGEGSGLTGNSDRFNEQVTGYDKMGNILGLLRYGQTSQTGYGLIDNLHMVYNGNQLQSVRDNATSSVYGNGMEFRDGANQIIEYEYDKNGNITKDLNKKIADIQYNILNLPSQLTFDNRNSVKYVYDANGVKLRTLHNLNVDTEITDYCGNAVYENGSLKMLLNEAGYVSLPDKVFHFYLKDHLGNVRIVADENGHAEEVNDYYPFGGTFTSSSSVQPYKYNGKELDRKNGLDWYDYGARHYDAAIGRWHVADPLAEKYYSISPYAYCLNNPMRYVDPKGKNIWDFLGGVVHSIGSNLSFGLANTNTNFVSNASHYNAGRNVGDVVSIVVGAAETLIGGTEAVAGAGGTVVTAGTGSLVTVPVAIQGVAAAAHGVGVTVTAAKSLGKQEGRLSEASSSNGRSGSSSGNGTTETTKTRQSPGNDGATSKHIIETDSKGNTVSKTHQVTDQQGNTIHQHQDFVPQNLPKGEKANTRQFPDEWVKYPNINTK